MGELKFVLTLKEESVVLDDKDYTLRELDGLQKGKYLNSMGGRLIMNEEGKVSGFKDFAGLESSLLSLCLYDSEGKTVPAAKIQSWPSSVLSKLFEAAQVLSGLNEEGQKKIEAEAKNS